MQSSIPTMIENKKDAPETWFFCDGCLAYHPPEYKGKFQSDYKKYCHFALSVIDGGDNSMETATRTPTIENKATESFNATESSWQGILF